jgi:hypothetical protein
MKTDHTNRILNQGTDQALRFCMLESLAGGNRVTFAAGDYVKFEMKDDATVESEWMWLRVDYCDDSNRLVFG